MLSKTIRILRTEENSGLPWTSSAQIFSKSFFNPPKPYTLLRKSKDKNVILETMVFCFLKKDKQLVPDQRLVQQEENEGLTAHKQNNCSLGKGESTILPGTV